MKKFLDVVLVLLGTATLVSAQGFQASMVSVLQPLTQNCTNGEPFPDGQIVQIYWDANQNGVDPNDISIAQFGLNGEELGMGPGFFLADFIRFAFDLPWTFYLKACDANVNWWSDNFALVIGYQEIIFGPGFVEWHCFDGPCSGCVPPLPPSDLDASDNLFCEYVLITWQSDEPLADIFQIRRNDEVIAEVINNGPDSWLYTDECTPGQVFQYRIRAGHQCEDGSYVYSNWDATPPNNGSRGNNAGSAVISNTDYTPGVWDYQLDVQEGCVSRFVLSCLAPGTSCNMPDGWTCGGAGDSVVFTTINPVSEGTLSGFQLLNSTAANGPICCGPGCQEPGPAFVDEANSPVLPEQFSLSVYPNPFNPTTTIEFGLPVAGDVDLKIFDIQGRAVGDIANGFQDAGWHRYTFDATNLSTGVYFAHIVSGNYVMTKKLMVMK